ncbi:site-specific tyrosine recombinase [Planctomycetota bacterium]
MDVIGTNHHPLEALSKACDWTVGRLWSIHPSMRIAIRSFLQYLAVECGLSRHTVKAYGRDLARFVTYLEESHESCAGALEPGTVEADHVRTFLWLERRRGLKSASIARALAAVKGLFKFLVAEGALQRSVVSEVDGPRKETRIPEVLSIEEMARFLEEPFPQGPLGLRDRAALELLYATGARASEVVALDAVSVRLDLGFLRVIGKGRKERIVPLGKRAREASDQYLHAGRPRLCGKSRPHEPALLLSIRGRRLSRNTLWRIVKARCLAIGIQKKTSPHTFRHSFATHLLRNGAGLRSVQEMLGHASVATTEIYTHIDRSQLIALHHRCHPRP